MGLNNFTTKTTILTISALTLCSVGLDSKSLPPKSFVDAGSTSRIIEEVNTQAIDFNYIEEQYSTPIKGNSTEHPIDVSFFEFIQKIDIPQHEMENEFLVALNKFEKIIGKEIPTKKRM